MSHLIAGTFESENDTKEILVDYKGHLIPIEYWHELVHAGKIWTANLLDTTLENSSQLLLRGTTGSKTLHIVVEYSNGGDGTFKTYTGTTYTTPDSGTLPDGTNLSLFNRNSQHAVPLETVFRYAPTVSILGTTRGLRAIQGGAGGNSTGSGGGGGIESNIPPNTDFLIAVTNLSGQTRIAGIALDCYET